MRVVIVNGVAGSGKDKFVSYVKKLSDFKVENLSSIDRVKQIAESCFGWNGKKNDESRKMLSEMKKVWTDFNNGPFEIVTKKIDEDLNWCNLNGKDINKNIYFVHVREPDEILKFKNFFGEDCITLLIEKNVKIPDNYSDKNVHKYNYNVIVENNGTKHDLELKAKDFLKFLV